MEMNWSYWLIVSLIFQGHILSSEQLSKPYPEESQQNMRPLQLQTAFIEFVFKISKQEPPIWSMEDDSEYEIHRITEQESIRRQAILVEDQELCRQYEFDFLMGYNKIFLAQFKKNK